MRAIHAQQLSVRIYPDVLDTMGNLLSFWCCCPQHGGTLNTERNNCQHQMETSSKLLSESLKKARGDRSQAEFARFLGIEHQATYQRYESGERMPDADVLHQMAMRIGVTMEHLMTGSYSKGSVLRESGIEFSGGNYIREKCHLYLDRLIESYGDDEDRKRWLLVEIKRRFPLSNSMTRAEAESIVDLAEKEAEKNMAAEDQGKAPEPTGQKPSQRRNVSGETRKDSAP